MDAGYPGNGPPGDNGDGARQPRKTSNGMVDVFGDSTELPFLIILFLAAMLAEYFRSISPCTC